MARLGEVTLLAPWVMPLSHQKSPASAVAVHAPGLKKHYDMGEVMIAALRGIDPDLYAGEFLVLLGPSDSGKSTLLNILGAFDAPSNGILSYEGDDLSIYSDAALTRYRRKPVSFVFQFYNLIRALTARENVVLVTEIAAAPRDGIGGHGRASKPVPRPDVGTGTAHGYHIASHCEATVLPLDEITGALVVEMGLVVLDAIQYTYIDLGTMTLVITNNAAVMPMRERVLLFTDGRVRGVERNETEWLLKGFVW